MEDDNPGGVRPVEGPGEDAEIEAAVAEAQSRIDTDGDGVPDLGAAEPESEVDPSNPELGVDADDDFADLEDGEDDGEDDDLDDDPSDVEDPPAVEDPAAQA